MNRTQLNIYKERIIGSAHKVINTLGPTFELSVYANALAHELKKSGTVVTRDFAVPIYYDGVQVGRFCTDLLVEENILVNWSHTPLTSQTQKEHGYFQLASADLPMSMILTLANGRLEVKTITYKL